MSKIKNRQRFSILNYKNLLFLLLIFIIFIFILSFNKNISNFFIFQIQKKSEQYGYIFKDISISGTSKLSKDEIKKIIESKFNKSIFLISLKRLKNQIIDNNWIQDLTLKVEYPSTISINIIEKKPIAIFINNNKEYFFIDSNGMKIDRVQNIDNENFIIITGENSLINLSNLIKNIKIYNNFKITSANYVGLRRWDLLLENTLKIKFN